MGFMAVLCGIEIPPLSLFVLAIDFLAALLDCIKGGIEMKKSSFLNRFSNVVAWLGGGESEPIKQQGF